MQVEFGAIILAAAGPDPVGFARRIRQVIPADTMLPAVGQGVLGIEYRRRSPHPESDCAPSFILETTRVGLSRPSTIGYQAAARCR